MTMSSLSQSHRKRVRTLLSRRVIPLPSDLDRCRHGHELHETATEQVGEGWIVWGRYGCPNCGRVGL